MTPITGLTGLRPTGANAYLPKGDMIIRSVSWCKLTDIKGNPLLNDAGEEYRPVLAFEISGEDKFFRVPRLTPRYTEDMRPILNDGAVLDLCRKVLNTTSTYEEVVKELSDKLVGKSISVARKPLKLVKNDLTPYVGQIVTVEFTAKRADAPQTPAATGATAQP